MNQLRNSSKTLSCRFCKRHTLSAAVDFGPQTIANRFVRKPSADQYVWELVLGFCSTCGVSQLIDPAPQQEIRARFDWISYREPEKHLSHLAQRISNLPGIDPSDRVLGFSHYDDSALEKLRDFGFSNASTLCTISDLQLDASCIGSFGMESYPQAFITQVEHIEKKIGRVKLVVARVVLEHARQGVELLAALQRLVRPDGYVVFEVPDNSRVFASCDYSFMWEEHIAYFTEKSLQRTLTLNNWMMEDMHSYVYPYEDVLSIVVRPADCNDVSENGIIYSKMAAGLNDCVTPQEEDLIAAYAANFEITRQRFQTALSEFRLRSGRKIAVFGAGHQSVSFINVLGLAEHIDLVIDDKEEKQGLFMPGSNIPIDSSLVLHNAEIGLCLLSLSPSGEKEVIDKNRKFIDSGGMFFSIYSSSERYFLKGEVSEDSRAKQRSSVC